jgi:hypothetical protein
MPPTPMKRTSAGLVDTLFDAIDNLNAKKIDTEHARALAHTARAIVAIASLELDFRRLQETNPAPLRSLTIEAPKDETA